MAKTDTQIGKTLEERRVALGLSINEAAETTRIRKEYLVALEADDYDKLPSAAYITGFLRSYADFLALNANQLVNSYLTQRHSSYLTDEPPLVVKKQTARRGVHLGVIILTGLLLVGYWITTSQPNRAQQKTAPTPVTPELSTKIMTDVPPPTTKPPVISTEPEPPASMQIPFKRDSILELLANGPTMVTLRIDERPEQRYAVTSGTKLRWKISTTAQVNITESSKIKLYLNQEPILLEDHQEIVLTRTANR